MKNRNPLTSKKQMKTPRWFSTSRFFSIVCIASGRALLCAATAMGLMAVLTAPSIAAAANPSHGVHYYIALGDSMSIDLYPALDAGEIDAPLAARVQPWVHFCFWP